MKIRKDVSNDLDMVDSSEHDADRDALDHWNRNGNHTNTK